MDILDLLSLTSETAVMTAEGPGRSPIAQADGRPITITLRSRDSEAYRAAAHASADAYLRGSRPRRADFLEADQIDLLAACTVEWDGVAFEGQIQPCTPENARKLYRMAPFLRDQVDAFIHNRANFTRAA